MATFNKFEKFVEDLAKKVHDLYADQLEVYLSNATPSASADAVKADLAEIGTGNGYTGPQDTQNTANRSGGTVTITGTKVVITASGAVGPFQYVVLQNTTPAAPLDPLIAWWDYASALTLQNGDSFSIKFNNSDTTGTIATLA
jgi:hypothetical protein